MIREKPSSIEEAREFLKGFFSPIHTLSALGNSVSSGFLCQKFIAGYSGRHAATVSSVIVTDLKSGFRRGDWDKVEVLYFCFNGCCFKD